MAKKGEKQRSKSAGLRAKVKAAFRDQVPAEVVDQLIHRFVTLVKHGLELMLRDPSELARQEFRQHPDLVYTIEEIGVLVLWAAVGAYELPWSAFCQHVLTLPQWAALLGVATQADLDRLAVDLEHYPIRVIELAVHDGLKAGDKQDPRPVEQRPSVQAENAKYIRITLVLKLLKKRLRPFLHRLDRCDPKRPRHRPRTYRTRAFVLADLARWILGLPSTDALIRELAQNPDLAGVVNFRQDEIPSKATFSRRRMAVPLPGGSAGDLARVGRSARTLQSHQWARLGRGLDPGAHLQQREQDLSRPTQWQERPRSHLLWLRR